MFFSRPEESKIWRPRLRFGLRSLFVMVLVTAVLLACLARAKRQQMVERQATASLVLDGHIYSIETSFGPPWWREAIGDAHFSRVHTLVVRYGVLGQAGLEPLRQLTHLESLELAGLAIGDDDLEALVPLSRLKVLALEDMPITDRGLVQIEQLPALERLTLEYTEISDQGIARLRRARPDLQIEQF